MFISFAIILSCGVACQPTPSNVLPTLAPTFAAIVPSAPPTQLRTAATQLVETPTTLLNTPPAPTQLPTPTANPFVINITPPEQPPPSTPDPLLLTQVALPTDQPLPSDTQVIGRSVSGRALLARRIEGASLGTPPRVLLLVGGMHGGWEANTVALVNELIAHYADNRADIPPGIALVFVPIVNPDGLLYGREAAGRFNTNGVDLNRNWGCGWQTEAFWRDMTVNAGAYAFSEPETSALADYIQALRPTVALFYHSAAGGVYAGSCESSIYGAQGRELSDAMSAVYGEAAQYRFGEEFDAYPVTGTAASWAAGLGIAAADVELQTWTTTEFERNLSAIQAVMEWVATL